MKFKGYMLTVTDAQTKIKTNLALAKDDVSSWEDCNIAEIVTEYLSNATGQDLSSKFIFDFEYYESET